MKSIRKTLIVRLLIGLEALTLMSALGFHYLTSKALLREFDAASLSKAQALAGMFEVEKDGRLEFNFDDDLMPEFSGGKSAEYFQATNAAGEIIQRSHSLHEAEIHPPPGRKSPFFDSPMPDRRKGRGAVLTFEPDKDHDDDEDKRETPPEEKPSHAGNREIVVVVLRGRAQLDATLHLIATGCFLLCLFLPLAGAMLVGWNVSTGLRPLDEVGRAAAAIDAQSLHHRFDAATMPEELRPICLRLNGLLEKLGEAFDRERRFNRNVAHELRTPIAELRAIAEVTLMESGLHATPKSALEEGLAIAGQMEKLVNSLILLAQCESKGHHLPLDAVDLAKAVVRASADCADASASSRIVCGLRPGDATIAAHDELLQVVLGNLLSNALEYSPRDTPVTVALDRQKDGCSLIVENANADLQTEDVQRMRDPFWRADESRHGGKHAGLGLSIVAAVCKAMRADFEIKKRDDKVFALVFFQYAPTGSGTHG